MQPATLGNGPCSALPIIGLLDGIHRSHRKGTFWASPGGDFAPSWEGRQQEENALLGGDENALLLPSCCVSARL